MEHLINLDKRLQQLEDKLANLISYGVVINVNCNQGTAVVDFKNGITSPELPFLQHSNTWNPPKVGEQVIVISPNGSLIKGFIIPQVYATGTAPDNTENTFKLVFQKGEISYKDGIITINADTQIVLNNESGEGIVCKKHLCAFSGSTHMQGSSTVKGAL